MSQSSEFGGGRTAAGAHMSPDGNRRADHAPSDLSAIMQRTRYRVGQGLRLAWYGAHYGWLRRKSDFKAASASSGQAQPLTDPVAQAPDAQAAGEEVRRAFRELFAMDRANVEAGLYPPPEDVNVRDLLRTLESSRLFFRDAEKVEGRRKRGDGVEVREMSGADRYPVYYRQNFHYQSGGWLTAESARLYDTQVEVLFSGAADAMRRMTLAQISLEIRKRNDTRAQFLDVACGTGRFLRQVMTAHPRLRAAGLDLSAAYCDHARMQVAPWPRADILQGRAEAMPVEDASQDIVSCIYLFHELPPKVRTQVAAEIARVLRPGGLLVFADSLQPGDNPAMDHMLDRFPEGFHEPYFKSYGETDLEGLFSGVGLEAEGDDTLAFLTRVMMFRKPA